MARMQNPISTRHLVNVRTKWLQKAACHLSYFLSKLLFSPRDPKAVPLRVENQAVARWQGCKRYLPCLDSRG
jgi:hypothetical protein